MREELSPREWSYSKDITAFSGSLSGWLHSMKDDMTNCFFPFVAIDYTQHFTHPQ